MIDPLLVIRVKRAWDKLKPQDQQRLQPHIEDAHNDLKTILDTGTSGPVKSKRELLYVQSSLLNDVEIFLKATRVAVERAFGMNVNPPLDADGDILGFGKFAILDPGWLEAAAVWLENFDRPLPPFRPCQPIRIGNEFTMALLADWGTGAWGPAPSPSMKILGLLLQLNPEVSVHLGDVYYAGTRGPEQHNLTNLWPRASWFSGTLNSNHEMYPAAQPYFDLALAADGPFARQAGSSVFVLENDFWVIVGLDTAYGSDKYTLYMHGVLDSYQEGLLRYARGTGKKILLLSHHNGLCEDGNQAQGAGDLFQPVQEVLGDQQPVWWYWGHVHCGAVYKTIATEGATAGNGYHCRCIGHGSLPWGHASALANSSRVAWFESTRAGEPEETERVCNGFAVLRFAGTELAEEFRTEDGAVSWRSS